MKKILTYGTLSMVLFFSACRKKDNPVLPDLTRVPVVSVVVTSGSKSISKTDPQTFNSTFTVDLLFKNDVKPSKVDIILRKVVQSSLGKDSTVGTKVFKAGITTWPTVLTVTGADILGFGAVALGDRFDFGADLYTQDGTKYEAFPAIGSAYGSGVTGEYGLVSLVASYSVLCLYNPDDYDGNFIVDEDGWQDTNPGDIIKFHKIDATHFSFDYPSVVNPIAGLPVVTVDAGTNNVSIAKVTLGTNFNYGAAYVNPTVRTYMNPNIVSPCAKSISLSLAWGYQGGEYGPYIFRLHKQ